MIYIIYLSRNSNYLSWQLFLWHLHSFHRNTCGPLQEIDSLIAKAPLNGHLKGKPNICVWLGTLLLRPGHWFCLLFNFLKALAKIWDWILIFSLSMICYFPISEERKVKLRNTEVSHRESHLRILVSCLCNYFRMGCFQDPQAESHKMRCTLADTVLFHVSFFILLCVAALRTIIRVYCRKRVVWTGRTPSKSGAFPHRIVLLPRRAATDTV